MKTEGARADQRRAFPDVPGKYRASTEAPGIAPEICRHVRPLPLPLISAKGSPERCRSGTLARSIWRWKDRGRGLHVDGNESAGALLLRSLFVSVCLFVCLFLLIDKPFQTVICKHVNM